jgi:hypothetical protein
VTIRSQAVQDEARRIAANIAKLLDMAISLCN